MLRLEETMGGETDYTVWVNKRYLGRVTDQGKELRKLPWTILSVKFLIFLGENIFSTKEEAAYYLIHRYQQKSRLVRNRE